MRAYVKRLEVPKFMNKPNKPKQPFDDDIAELFDAQELEVTAALDDHIRNMARAELSENAAVVGSATSRYAPVFATAAVMVLAVALVPMLIDQSTSPEISSAAIEPTATEPASPETSSDASFSDIASDLASTADRASKEARAKVRAESMPIERPAEETIVAETDIAARSLKKESKPEPVLAQEQSALKGGSAGALEDKDDGNTNDAQKLPKQSSPTVTSEFADATSTMKMPSALSALTTPNTAAADNLLTDGSRVATTSDSEDAHRASQASWLKELSRLYEVEEQSVFLDELILFKKQYPLYDLSKSLPPAALKLKLSD